MPRAAWKSRCPPVSAHSELRIPDWEAKSGNRESSPSVLTEWVVHLWATKSLPGGTWKRKPPSYFLRSCTAGNVAGVSPIARAALANPVPPCRVMESDFYCRYAKLREQRQSDRQSNRATSLSSRVSNIALSPIKVNLEQRNVADASTTAHSHRRFCPLYVFRPG